MLKQFIKACLGGLAISIGAVAYLSVDNKVIGSFLFSLGIFTIYSFGFSLYTGKVCFIPNKEPSFCKNVGISYLGNAVGTVLTGLILPFTKLKKLIPALQVVVEQKLNDTLLSSFIMAILCGVLICISVMGYIKIKDGLGKYIALILPIMVFILSGFEHSIANLFYYTFASSWSFKAVIYSFFIAIGNCLGGMLIPLAVKYTEGSKLGCEEK